LAALASAAPLSENQYQFLFTKWVQQYNKNYEHDEFFIRYNVFKSNLDKVLLHNQSNSSFSMAMNEFGDLTWEEFKSTRLGYKHISNSFLRSKNQPLLKDVAALPTAVDWRAKNAVTPVKNQQQCGSCWAFSTTGAIEGAHAIKTGSLVSLSEQQLVDCAGSYGNEGCSGGLMDQGFEYVIGNKGLCAEAAYPYKAADGSCKRTCEKVVTITGYKDVPANDEAALLAAVAGQPVSVAIEADTEVFQFYSGGVLDSAACGTNLDHGVLVVGYGTDAGKDYWIVKNSWGASWGENGYIRLARNKNTCGISLVASYPTA